MEQKWYISFKITTILPVHLPLLLPLCQTMETQMEEWYKEAGQLQVQTASIPQQTQIQGTVVERQAAVETRMARLIEPLKERRRLLLACKEVHQVGRDLEDEIVSRRHRPLRTWEQS